MAFGPSPFCFAKYVCVPGPGRFFMPKARQIFGYLHCLRDCCGGAAGMDRRASFICTITKMTLHQGSKNLTSLYHMLFPNKKGSAACLNPVFGQGSIVSYVITQSGQKHRRTQDIQRQKQHKNNKLYKDVRAVLLCNVKFSGFRADNPQSYHLLQEKASQMA